MDGGKKINKNLRFDEIFQPHFFEPEKDKEGVKGTSVLYGFYFIILFFFFFL